MKRLMTKLLALCVALAIPGGMALSEPLIVDAANEEEIILPDPEIVLDLHEVYDPEWSQDGIALEDIPLEVEAPEAAANDTVTSGTCGENVRWTLDSDGLLTISGSGDMDNDTYFFYYPGIRRVVVEPGVTSIGMNAFNGCDSLESVSLPDGLRNIWAGAFQDCWSLTAIEIPYGVPFISAYVFADCISLKEVTLPESVTEIVDHAFDGCMPRYITTCDGDIVSVGLTIKGYDGSYAETYAWENDIPFVSLGAAPARPPLPTEAPTPTEPPTQTPTPTEAPIVTPTPTEVPRISLSNCSISVKNQVYSGKAKKPAVEVTLNGQALSRDADYTVEYGNNKAIGTATVTVTGIGRYTDVAHAEFSIVPKAVAGLKLTAGKGQVTASWKKAAGGVSGYQLQYGLKKSFSGAKKVTAAKAATVKKTLKGLKKNSICYLRIRAYKKIGGKTYWSAWSGAKAVKVK